MKTCQKNCSGLLHLWQTSSIFCLRIDSTQKKWLGLSCLMFKDQLLCTYILLFVKYFTYNTKASKSISIQPATQSSLYYFPIENYLIDTKWAISYIHNIDSSRLFQKSSGHGELLTLQADNCHNFTYIKIKAKSKRQWPLIEQCIKALDIQVLGNRSGL